MSVRVERPAVAMLPSILHLFCRLRWVFTAILAVQGSVSGAQSIVLNGVAEGSSILLSGAATNLTITAAGSNLPDGTELIFSLEYQGAILTNVTVLAPYAVTFHDLRAGKYFLIARSSEASSDVSFDIKAALTRPVNDNWAQATSVTALDAQVSGSNLNATSEADEPKHADVGIGKSIWWAWTAPAAGIYTVSTAGSSFDTALAVYTGATLAGLDEVAANDDIGPNTFSQVTFATSAGVTYYIAVDSVSAASVGEAKLRVSASSPSLISLGGITNRFAFFVKSPMTSTNVSIPVTVNGTQPTTQVSYWLAGPTGDNSGTLVSPYQLALGDLREGHYLLSLAAMDSAGLVTVTNSGFSVVSLAPKFILTEFKQTPTLYQFGLLGIQGAAYDLEGSGNLSAWSSKASWTNFSGAEILIATNVFGSPNQFYRAVLK